MRMWMVNPKTMCRNHLLGEHVECHMFIAAINRRMNIKGYLDKGLVEVHNLQRRHEDLAQEMLRRGYKHNSSLEFSSNIELGKIDPGESAIALHSRCSKCRELSLLGSYSGSS
jgi:hypothetical protein